MVILGISTTKLQTDLNLHNFVAQMFLFRKEDKQNDSFSSIKIISLFSELNFMCQPWYFISECQS